MSKTQKLGGIMLTSILSLQILRIVVSFLPLSDNVTTWLFDFVMQILCLCVMPFVLYKVFISSKSADFARDVRITTRISPKSFLLAIAIGFFAYVINIGASTVSYVGLELLGYTFVKSSGTIYSGVEVLILDIICTAVFPAVCEEITNRGVLMAALDDEKNDAAKIIFMGVFFGAFHQNIGQFFPTMIVGIIIAYMAVKSQSILPGMIVHFMNNFFITITSYSTQTGSVFGSLMNNLDDFLYSNVIVLVAAVGLSIWLITLCLRSFAKINARYRNERDAFPEVKTGGQAEKETIRQSIYGIYGYPVYKQEGAPASNYTVAHTAPVANKAKVVNKVNLKNHVFLIIAFIAAMAVTVFTYVWGVLR